MMKNVLIILLIICITVANASAQIVISQVLYNPTATESGSEAVELYNPTNSSVDISGWILRTESSSADATIPEQTILLPHTSFLIADAGWSENKQNTSWPDADYEEAISLTNEDAGIALMNGETIIDAVGWGNAENIEQGLFEGTPAEEVNEGNTLRRTTDTNNNADDFIEITPLFHNSTTTGLILIGTIKTVYNETTIVITDDQPDEGIQITPLLGRARDISINITTTSSSAVIRWGTQEQTLQGTAINETHHFFSSNWSIPFNFPPGMSTPEIELDKETQNVPIEILETQGIEIDTDILQFEAESGKQRLIQGDTDLETETYPTIKNIGNTPLDIILEGTGLEIQYSCDNFATQQQIGSILDLNLDPAETAPLSIRINIPDEAQTDLQADLTIRAIKQN